MNGIDYVALRRLSDKASVALAAVGETCERVPVSSLPGLLASGKIALRPTVPQASRSKADGKAAL